MRSERVVEGLVGLFVMTALLALIGLAFKVSGLTHFFDKKGYDITAIFDEVGQLKVRSAVKIGGVTVGEVSDIFLDPTSFKGIVKMHIDSRFHTIPNDSVASILTAGLLGDNYIAITPMYNKEFLTDGSQIQETHSAMILEKLIGQLVYKFSNPAKGG